MSLNPKFGGFDAAALIRRLLFFVLLFGLVFFYLILTFKGLTEPHGMDHAQLGREIARGNGTTTKVIRPAAVWQGEKNIDSPLQIDAFQDTFHSPLNPFVYAAVLKAVGATDFDKFRINDMSKSVVFPLDRVIASVSIVFFLMAIGINYLLISRIFDVRIAGVTVLLMILSDLMWKFTQTGLPQMLMLLLFSCALFFIYRALENTSENRVAIGSVLIAAVFLALLALAHWLTLWITLGYIIYAAFFIRPKGVAGLSIIGILLVFSLYFMGKNMEWTGNPGGTAFLSLYGGLLESEDAIMRTSDPSEETYRIIFNLNSLLINTTSNILKQANLLYNNLGAIIAAPLFFFALLHPFKRDTIARFRWIVLLMWATGTLGMAIFGLSNRPTDPNQLHILFAPIMSAYGLAFLSILWSRIELPAGSLLMQYGHFVLVVVISAGPILLSIPREMSLGINIGISKRLNWPPYWPPALNKTLHDATSEEDVIFSDQPWAVAWYADRISIWLPRRISEFEDLQALVQEQKLNPAGILVSPASFADNPLYRASPYGANEEFAALMLNGPAFGVTEGRLGSGLGVMTPSLSKIMAEYNQQNPLFPLRMIYYAKKRIAD